MRHLDDEAVSPILVWDASCRDRLSALAWAHWEDWRRRGKVGASLRWVPAYLPEEVLLPAQHSSEPCVAGLYFRLYAAEPGFALEKDMVEGFLVCSVEVREMERGGARRMEGRRPSGLAFVVQEEMDLGEFDSCRVLVLYDMLLFCLSCPVSTEGGEVGRWSWRIL